MGGTWQKLTEKENCTYNVRNPQVGQLTGRARVRLTIVFAMEGSRCPDSLSVVFFVVVT